MTGNTPHPDSDANGTRGGAKDGPVTVAIGPNGSPRAVSFGIRVSRILGADLHLLHVVEPLVGVPEASLLAEVDVEEAGREVLDVALASAREQAEGVVVTGEVVLGHPVPSIVNRSERARMVVLEHRDLSRLARLVIRSVTRGVAAQAHVPVVSVPEKWESRPGVPLTIAVEEPATAHELLRIGAVAARALDVPLRVLNVWTLPTAYEGLQLTPDDDATLAERSHREIGALLAEHPDDVAGVRVEVVVVRGRVVDALLEASRESSLLVMGRHDPALPFGSHLGPIARTVFRGAHSPVMLVDLTH